MNNFFITTLSIFLMNLVANGQSYPYQNADLSIDERVEDLLDRMNWEEKIAQTYCVHFDEGEEGEPPLPLEDYDYLNLDNGVGQMGKPIWSFDKGREESAEITNRYQRQIMDGNRWGIPAIFHEEGLHGLWARDATVFPQAIGMSCTWDPDLISQVFAAIAKETRSRGSHQLNTPMMDVCRDPRWGRIEESYGEDPYLTSRFAVKIVKALQGPGPQIGKDNVVATIKHFAGYGITEGALNQTPNYMGERSFREVILPPFKSAVMEAGALSVMPAYNEIDGIPAHSNSWLLKDVLREEWGFEGYVVGDYGGVNQLHNFHNIVPNPTEAARLAMKSGVDMELPVPESYINLPDIIDDDKELQAAVNDAVRRILRVKFLLGLFDDPYADPNSAEEVNRAQEHLDLSLEVAEETMVLLKNEKNILPLSKSDYKKIAVIGPHSNETHYGGYAHKDVSRGITIYQGLKDYLGDDVEVTTAQGCKIHGGSYHWLGFDDFELANPEENRRMIEEAVKVAEDSELVILAVGGTAVETGEFIGYRNELGLFGSQKKLVAAIMALNKPTIITLINGRPYTIPDLHAQADAILEAWYPGEFAGVAIANTLYGENNPSGKLTLSFPRMIGDLPVYYSKKESSSTKDYLAEDTKALYPFGYGLSYTSFEYSDFEIDKSTISEGGQVQVSGILRNTGDRAGEEIVQYYIRDRYSSASRPIKELKGFRKVSLEPGESKSVSWTLSIDDLRFYDHQMNYVVEPGRFEIMVGASSEDIKFETSFTLE